MFLLSFRNTSQSLGEWEMLWEHKQLGECFHIFFKFFYCKLSHLFLYMCPNSSFCASRPSSAFLQSFSTSLLTNANAVSVIRVQWLSVVDKIPTFPHFSEVCKEHLKINIWIKNSWEDQQEGIDSFLHKKAWSLLNKLIIMYIQLQILVRPGKVSMA